MATAAQMTPPPLARHADGVDVQVLATPGLGNRSYLIADGTVAVAVDPPRDIDRVTAVLHHDRLQLAAVLETHLHNDYLSGGLVLARRHDVDYLVPAGPRLGFTARRARDGDEVRVGRLRLRVLATAGHTDHHLAYVVGADDRPDRFVCTGGSLLYGSCGRTDLMGADRAEPLACQQFRSLQRLVSELPGDTIVLPTHGFGSFCSATTAPSVDQSTIQRERETNPTVIASETDFLDTTIRRTAPYPNYYRHMGPRNAAGPPPVPAPAAPAAVDTLPCPPLDGAWVLDVRPRRDFAAGHLLGSTNVECSNSLASYVGWLVPFDAPFFLLAGSREQLDLARTELVRIGYDRPNGVAVGNPADAVDRDRLASYPTATFAELASARQDRPLLVLDVRHANEWSDGHVASARHVPLPDLPTTLPALPDVETWVYCASGFRAAIAASLLQTAGRPVVLVDDQFDVCNRNPGR